MTNAQKYYYPAGFFHWLNSNKHIYRAFSNKALAMARTGRPRYSARTLVEVLRWDTDLADTSTTFKIDNDMIPGMARLWLKIWGTDYPKFFALRDNKTK